jgi:hypothetical protein
VSALLLRHTTFAEEILVVEVLATHECPFKFAIGDAVRFVAGDQYGSGVITFACASNGRVVMYEVEGELWKAGDEDREDSLFLIQVPIHLAHVRPPSDKHVTLWACEEPDVVANFRGDVSFESTSLNTL